MTAIRPAFSHATQSGNMLVYILGAIFLMGLLMVLVKGSTNPGGGIDAENVIIRASDAQRYTGEIERAILNIMHNGESESDIRFAHPNAPSVYGVIGAPLTAQVFDPAGGAAEYRAPPSGINDGTAWQFYATTHIKDLGTDGANRKAELIMVLPNVTEDFCNRINELNDQDLTLTDDHDPSANGCIYDVGNEFTGTYASGGSVNEIDDTLFTHLPPNQACIHCESDDKLHYYHVLLAR
jgi:hypothetical protein